MARRDHPHPHQQGTRQQRWGTLEELLLACAVSRHGTAAWDSVAMEVQSRTNSLHSTLTSQHCIDKFNDLKRRFTPQNDTESIVDELRRIRVEELRREVQRCDVSIVSLEMKVKKLEEERERSLKEDKTDLARENNPSPETIAANLTAGEDDERSFNESNSTSQQKAETTPTTEQNDSREVKPEPDPVQGKSGLKTDRDWSRNVKLEGDDNDDEERKEIVVNNDKSKKTKPSWTSGLGDSVSRKEKENSDVQSSASLSVKNSSKEYNNVKKRLRSGVGSSSGGDDGEEDDDDEEEEEVEVSPATKKKRVMDAVKPEPFVKLLGIIRSHRLGSTFERRLRSQESARYKNLIHQHMDLRIIQSRLDKGMYSNCAQKFFRDLLLLFNNAIIFFKKNSPESLAAYELRNAVMKELTEKLRRPRSQPVDAKPAGEQLASFSKAVKSSSTMVACGRRSSTKATSDNAKKKADKKDVEVEEKQDANKKKNEGLLVVEEEKAMKKKSTKERSVTGQRNSRTSVKNGEVKHQYGGNELSSHDALEIKVDKKESMVKKKQGAASFLKRMKQNSPGDTADNGEEADEDDSSENESKESKVNKVERKGRGKNRDGMVSERVTRSSRGKGSREHSGKGRGTSRPTKKQEIRTPESGGGTVKRGRDSGGSGAGAGSSGRAVKRTRR